MTRLALLLVGLGLAWTAAAQLPDGPAALAEARYQAGLVKQSQAEMAGREADARRLYGEAIAAYDAAIAAQPQHGQARLYGAVCGTQLALLTPEAGERTRLLREANDRYAAAADCPGADTAVFEQWAILLRIHLYNALTDPAEKVAALQQVVRVCERGLPLAAAPTPRAQLQRHLGSALMWSAAWAADPAAQRALLERAVENLRAASEVVTARQALYESNDLGRALLSLGRLAGDPARLREAAAEFEAALQHYPNQHETRYNLAATYSLLGDTVQAGKHLAVAIDHDPDGSYSRQATTDPDLAAVRASPAYAEAVDRRRRRLLEARTKELLDQALQAQRAAEIIRDPAAVAARLREAVALYDEAAALVPDHFESQILHATALVKLGQLSAGQPEDQRRWFDAAHERFASAARCPGAEPDLYEQWSAFLLGLVYPSPRSRAEQQQVLGETRAVLEAGIARARFTAVRGRLEARLGTCLVMLAQQATVETNAVPLYAAAVKHFQAADATANLPRPVEFYELWGVALMRSALAPLDSSRLRLAVERFHKAVELRPDDPILHYNLACAYAQLGQLDQALRHLQRSLAQDPQETLRASAERDPWLEPVRQLPAYRRAFPPRQQPAVVPRQTVSPR